MENMDESDTSIDFKYFKKSQNFNLESGKKSPTLSLYILLF